MKELRTPYYLIDEERLYKNLIIIDRIRKLSGAKILLALKCFSSYSVFDLIKQHVDGTTSSSLYETKLGYESIGKETHAYCVGFKKEEIEKITQYASKIVFNSLHQYENYHGYFKPENVGIRVNPHISYSDYPLADPCCSFSRLGISSTTDLCKILYGISGLMFHFNCDNDNFDNFVDNLYMIESSYKEFLKKIDWISLGGGISFTNPGYPVDSFCDIISSFAHRNNVQVYFEPGEAIITHAAELVTSVVDITSNQVNIAVVDASTEAHMLDLLTYSVKPLIGESKDSGQHQYMIAGRSCLAGDLFGLHSFEEELKVGDILHIQNAAGYSMVKKNWFNGLQMPSIAVKRLIGKVTVVREFTYHDFIHNLS